MKSVGHTERMKKTASGEGEKERKTTLEVALREKPRMQRWKTRTGGQ